MKIGDIDLNKDVLVVAEIGNNHEGNYALAEEMVGLAARAGAGAVKFQTIIPDQLVSCTDSERIKQLKKFCLTYDDFEKLSKVAKREGVIFLSTPFDIKSAHFLNPLVPAFKIASGDNNFYPLIEVIARTGKPIILSSGLADLEQVRKTKKLIVDLWHNLGIRQELAILHCVVNYPTPPREANLGAIRQIAQLGVTVGYSDHTIGIEAAALSVALGARIVEKHFTVSKNYSDFRDHRLSADPKEFSDLVCKIKEIIELLGNGEKCLQDGERVNAERVRRSIVACRDLRAGTTLSWEDLSWVRPGGGLPPGEEKQILGKKLKHALRMGEPIVVTGLE